MRAVKAAVHATHRQRRNLIALAAVKRLNDLFDDALNAGAGVALDHAGHVDQQARRRDARLGWGRGGRRNGDGDRRRRRRRDEAPPRGGHGVDQPRLDPAQRLEHVPGGRIDDLVAFADQLRQFRAQVIELIVEQPDPLVLRFVPLRRFLGHRPALSTPRQ